MNVGLPLQPTKREFSVEELIPYWQKIADAIQNAPLNSEYLAKADAQDKKDARFFRGEIGGGDINTYEVGVGPGVIKFPDFETLLVTFSVNEVLVKILPEEQIREMIRHEQAHVDEAKKHGYDTEICLTITKTPEGGLVFTPSVIISVDSAVVDSEEVRKHLQEIAQAPQEDMSDSDKKKI